MDIIEEEQKNTFNSIYEKFYFKRWNRYIFYKRIKETAAVEILKYYFKGDLSQLYGLEIGCGIGSSTDYFNNITKKTIGLDISNRLIDLARVLYPKTEFVISSGADLRYKENSFDFIIIFVTFNHLKREVAEKVLEEGFRVLKPKGLFIVCEPNIENIFVRALLKLFGVSNKEKGGNYFYKKKELINMFLDKGFSIYASKSFGIIPYPLRFIYSQKLDLILSKTFPSFGGYFVIGATSNKEAS